MKKSLIILLSLGLLQACINNPVPPDPDPEDTTHVDPQDTVPPVDPQDTLPPIDPLDTIPFVDPNDSLVSLQSEFTHVQPMTGLVLWPDQARDRNSKYNQSISMEFSYCLPCKVVTGKESGAITYDWTWFENLLNDIASRNHQAIVRFRYEYPSGTDVDGKRGTTAVPNYIKVLPNYHETYAANPGGDGPTYYADWSNSELQWFTKQFYTDFAARYGHDPRIAFLEVGFGHWAEYHIYDGPYVEGKTFPSKQFQAEFMRGMAEWFKETTWSISIDAADHRDEEDERTYGPFHDYPDLLKLRFGNFDDSFMCEDHDGYNYKSWAYFGTGRYKNAPLGGEFSYYTDYDQKHCLDKAGMYGRKFEDEVAKFHMTYIIGADQPEYQSWSRIRQASLSMGYKFRIEDYRINGNTAAIKISNVGVAPIYRDAWVAVDGVRSDWSIAALMPGKSKWLEITVPGLSESSIVSIECDHLVKGQKIRYEADLSGE